jgi:hypothetical protein
MRRHGRECRLDEVESRDEDLCKDPSFSPTLSCLGKILEKCPSQKGKVGVINLETKAKPRLGALIDNVVRLVTHEVGMKG